MNESQQAVNAERNAAGDDPAVTGKPTVCTEEELRQMDKMYGPRKRANPHEVVKKVVIGGVTIRYTDRALAAWIEDTHRGVEELMRRGAQTTGTE